jgi:hypothetical protein
MRPLRATPNSAVLASCKPRHRHQEFLSFLREIDKAVAVERRQLRHAQAPKGQSLAGKSAALAHALHPHL